MSAETTSSSAFYYKTLTPLNRILLYFLCCSIFLAIGIIFKIIRRASVLFWPYPFEDFVDYCTVTNISFVFIKKRLPHAYYLHAALPDRTDVTYREINDAIRRGLKKNRSMENEVYFFLFRFLLSTPYGSIQSICQKMLRTNILFY